MYYRGRKNTGNERALRSFIPCILENTETRVKRAAYRLIKPALQ